MGRSFILQTDVSDFKHCRLLPQTQNKQITHRSQLQGKNEKSIISTRAVSAATATTATTAAAN